ncbi:sulfur carrier protein ThiS [Nitriliruptor alkaliphilus]|uniref:sulfur carrier protein ThiS n=1 Tax=Nitriliruptor alkaliphilus TaxID=427918 RepID=UPI0006990CC5|nr:sulfur carrier protein ThiS [Nitriliruptor alkaliphilus]
MELTVNGETHVVPEGTTVAEVVAELLSDEASPGGVAVAVDEEVVPRARWADLVLEGGARVEVVTAVAGG